MPGSERGRPRPPGKVGAQEDGADASPPFPGSRSGVACRVIQSSASRLDAVGRTVYSSQLPATHAVRRRPARTRRCCMDERCRMTNLTEHDDPISAYLANDASVVQLAVSSLPSASSHPRADLSRTSNWRAHAGSYSNPAPACCSASRSDPGPGYRAGVVSSSG
jgi:hypothetical protein